MLSRPLTFLDLETTGLSAGRDRVIEVGLCEVDDGRLTAEWSTLIDPQCPIPSFIRHHTGIDDNMVAGAPAFAEIGPQLHARLRGRLLIAHNASFDRRFLVSEFGRLGLALPTPFLCTVRLSRRLFPAERRHGLDAVMARHGLSCSARHRALGDARVLWDFVETLYRDLPPEKVTAAANGLLAGRV